MSTNETILFTLPANELWEKLREIVQSELQKLQKNGKVPLEFTTPGLTVKPIYKAQEICDMLNVTRQTLFEWRKEGILVPRKIKSRTFYLWSDIEKLLGINT